jgi:protein SCO1/2
MYRFHDCAPPSGRAALSVVSSSRRAWLAGGLGLFALLAGCRPAPLSFNGIDLTGAEYGRDFRLHDADGRERSLADFRGRALMLFFGFTQCPDVCPTALTRALEIRQLLGADGDRLAVVFVTIDPERDTSEVLKAYVSAFDPSFVALRGDAAQTAEVAREFKVFYKKVPTGASYTMDHTALSYVFDPSGRLRLALRHEQDAAQCAADLRQILGAA